MTEFDEVYYEKLMDGLEIQEIMYSELEFSGRIDAEYYQKNYLAYEKIIHKWRNNRLCHLADFLIGPFGSAYDTNNYTDVPDFRYVRGQDIKPFILKNTEARYMTKEDFNRLSKYALKIEDILVSVVGTLGNACIIRKKDIPAIFSCKSTVIRTNAVSPYFLTTYLNSKYGRNLLLRKERGVIQKGLNLDDLKMLDVPLFSNEFQNVCKKFINEALELMDASADVYKQAEELLIETLGLKNFAPQTAGYSIRSYKTSFGDTRRWDAEYYQSEYDNYDNLLKQYHNGYGLIGDICTIKDKNYNPEHKTEYSYIELSDVGQQGDINECNKIYGIDLPTRARRKVSAGDVILSSVEGSLSKCALITPDCDGYLCTNGFYVVRCDSINPETLMMLFKSRPVQALLKKGCSGTILSAIGKDELLKIPLPIIDIAVQEKIMCMVAESNLARRQGKELLDKAVRLVETAIEQGEDVALRLYV